jgi:hypothetical protein
MMPTPDMDSARLYAQERDAALVTLDMAWARRMMPAASCDEVRLAAMHKVRYDCTTLPRELRLASGEWLREHGMSGMQGRPLLPPGQLP